MKDHHDLVTAYFSNLSSYQFLSDTLQTSHTKILVLNLNPPTHFRNVYKEINPIGIKGYFHEIVCCSIIYN